MRLVLILLWFAVGVLVPEESCAKAFAFWQASVTHQQAYVKQSAGQFIAPHNHRATFGYSVSVSGDTLAVGANYEDSSTSGVGGNETDNLATNSGAVYVFTRSGVTWSQQAYIKASNTGAGDEFGYSVSLSGDTLAVAAYGEDSNATGIGGADNNLMEDSGAVYVFTRSGVTWSQQAYIKASNTGAWDAFGSFVSVSGDTLAVGAGWEASNATGINGANNDLANSSGAVYVFTRSGVTWTQQAYIKASNTGANDWFGVSVSVSGDTLAVGAPNEDSNATGIGGADNNLATDSGAVYVFTRTGVTWSQQAYIKASNTGANDFFGISVSVSGDTLAVGAYREASNATGINGADNDLAGAAGAVYVFTRSGVTWSQQAYIKASNTGAGDDFGYSVSVSGDTLAVGAGGEDSNATGIGGADNDLALGSGAVYVFTRSGVTWSQQAYIKASNTGAGDWFGFSVSVSGDTLAVGAPWESSNAMGINGGDNDLATDAGAVYVFTRSGVTWSQQAYIKASNTVVNVPFLGRSQFGHSVSISGDTLAVGATGEDSNATGVNGDQANNLAAESGAVYVFTRSGSLWSPQAYIKASNTEAHDNFGYSVSVSGDTLAVGAHSEDSSATGINGANNNSADGSGAVYVFTRSGVTWSQQAYVKASNTGGIDQFGQSVSVSGDTLAVGAPYEDSSATGINGANNDSASNSGAVYVFTRSGVTWTQQAYVKASNTGAGDQFGYSVSVSGDTLAVGAGWEDSSATGINGANNNSAGESGAVYVFTRSGVTWTQQAYVKASNTGGVDLFGYSVSVSGDTLAVGAPNEDSNATGVNGANNNLVGDSGAVYVFTRSGVTWSQQAYIKASNTGAADYLGRSVSVSGNTLVVGAVGEDSNATGINGANNDSAMDSGAVYVFTRSGVTWSQRAYIKASNTEAGDAFGVSVSVSGDTLAVGAPYEDSNAAGVNGNQSNNTNSSSGAVYVFKL